MSGAKQPSYNWILAVYAFLFPLGVSALAFWERAPLVFHRLGTEKAAAWAQAIFSVAAIGVAISLSIREARRQRAIRNSDEAEICRLSIIAVEGLREHLEEVARVWPRLATLPNSTVNYYSDQWEGAGRRRLRAASLMLSRPFPTRAMEALLVIEDAAQGLIEIAREARGVRAQEFDRARWVSDMLSHLADVARVLELIGRNPEPPFLSR